MGVDGVVSAGDFSDGFDNAGDGGVPAVVVLGSEAGDNDAAVVEGGGEGSRIQEFGDCEAVAFDPVLFCEVDGWEGCEAAVCWGGDDEVLLRITVSGVS